MAIQRGLEAKHEQDPRLLIRDTRTLGRRVYDFFKDSSNAAIVIACMGVTAFVMPALADISLLIGSWIFIFSYTRKVSLPFRLPQRSNKLDYNDTYPGSTKPRQARGITFFGNERNTNEELWFNNDDMRTHVLIFGSTGSGKTVFLVSLAYNALIQGSGFIYVDGKGDNSLFSQVFSMCRQMGREDDLLLINFMTGARDVVGAQEHRLSNTMNPFCSGSSSMLSNLVVSLMESSSASPDGDMWKGRAISFVEALMRVLVYARDKEYILLDANVIRYYFTLEHTESLSIDKVLPRKDQEPIDMSDAPESVFEPIYNYIMTLPGFDKSKKGKQVSQVFEQHGFITMQLTRIFSSLADTYGHILRHELAEVDMRDVVLNRRILVVLLPALEKSPDELSNLGKVVVSSLRVMMAAGLGDNVEGHYHDVIERKPTNSETPFMCILDEYGYYAVKGFAVVPAQARSLGFSTIFAGQDLPAFQKASKEEAASIGANTNIKIAMKLEDPLETWDFFSKTAGEAFVTKVDAFQTQAQSLTNTYLDTRSSSVERRARIDLLDLKEQREGEAHIFFKSKIVRCNTFFANPPPVKYMRLNHFIKVGHLKTHMINEMTQRFNNFAHAIEDTAFYPGPAAESEEISEIARSLSDNAFLNPIERSVTAMLGYHNRGEVETVVEEEEALPQGEMNIFASKTRDPVIEAVTITDDMESFCQPLLQRRQTYEHIEYIERLSGKPGKHAGNIAEEIVKDMKLATHYPTLIRDQYTSEEFTHKIQELIEHINKTVEQKNAGSSGFAEDELF